MPTSFFAADEPIFTARAPGRLDVMGGIADYSGSLVLQLPLDRHTVAQVQLQDAPSADVVSLRNGQPFTASISLEEFLHGAASTPESIRRRLPAGTDSHWAAYVVGVAHARLVRDAATRRSVSRGFRLRIESDVPEGKGVSSSAALEVAALAAIDAAYGARLSAEQIAIAAQWAENHVAGAPCGIMDQMTSACGRRDHLLQLRCQPATIEGQVRIPDGYRFYGIDSGIRHAVSGADYATVRTAAFMGYRMIAAVAGLTVNLVGDRVRVDDERWQGYLANISPMEFVSRFETSLPEQMLGADFLTQFGGVTDNATRVQLDRLYPIRQATAHPIRENARVELFASLLGELSASPECASEMGHLMFASHESYGACGLGSDGTDRLVELVAEAGLSCGLYGAKITGGGSGGTVAILGTEDAESAVRAIAVRYEKESGRAAEVFARSGAGMAETGVSRSDVIR